MANKKISELQSRTPVLADLMLVGDPSSGYAYKCTITALSTVIETAIGGNYVTLATTQTISGAKTFSNNVTLTSVQNAPTDPDKFLTLNASNVVTYRTGAEVLSDIGGQGSITLTTTGTSGAATLVGNTLNIPQYSPDLSGYVPNTRTLTINGTSYDLSANRTWSVGTVTSVAATAGTGISISGSPITSSGTLTITNTAPDQTVVLTAGTGISVSGTYPSFTIAATSTATISGSGTTNYIPKFTSSSAIGNSVIYDQSGLIGINTTTPGSYNANAYNLVVGGTSDAGITIFGNSAEGSSNLYLADGTTGDQAYRGFLRYTHSNDALTIGTSGITRMTLDASGNLGLGLTPNTWPAGQIAFEFGSLGTLVSTGSTVSLQNNSYNNGTNNIRKVIGEASSYNQSGGAHIWQYAASGASGSTISFSEAMRITSAGNVGIGTASPASYDASGNNLVVYENGNAGITIATPSTGYGNLFFADGTGSAAAYAGYLEYNHNNNALAFGTNSSERMRLDASGNLGLGVTPSAWSGFTTLELQGGFIGGGGSTYFEVGQNNYFDGSFKYKATGAATIYEQNAGKHLWYIAPSGTAGNAISFTQAMTLDASGRLLIGGTSVFLNSRVSIYQNSTNRTLSLVASTAKTNTTENPLFSLNSSETSTPQSLDITYKGNASIGSRYFAFQTSETGVAYGGNILFQPNGGNVGIGTTGDASYKLLVKGNNASVDANGQNTLYLSAGTSVSYIATSYIGGGSYVPIAFEVGGSERMRITSGGEVYIAGTTDQGAYNLQVNGTGVWGAGAYVNGSDSALKQNIQPLDNSLDLVKQMKPVTYTYKESYSKDTSVQTGFIAQDLQILLKDKNYLNGIVKDGTYLSVAYQNLIPLLVKAIQEQQIEIEKLKNK
jgi:hypothetical protein